MTKHEVKKDIFDDMHVIIRCEYISDLRYKQFAVFYELKSMNLNVYSHENLEDFSQYVFGIEYNTLKNMVDKKIVFSKNNTYKSGNWKDTEE